MPKVLSVTCAVRPIGAWELQCPYREIRVIGLPRLPIAIDVPLAV